MLAKCISIAARYIDRGGYSPAQFMDDLEELREVDTPETEPIEHINLQSEQLTFELPGDST